MAQTSGFDPMLKVKTCFDCKMFDVANWVAHLNVEDGPRGMPSPEALSVSSKRALEIFSGVGQLPSLVRYHFSSPRVMTKPCKHVEGWTKDHSNQIFTDGSNKGWTAHLEQVSTKGLWSDR